MSRRSSTLDPQYFDELYASNPDPWEFETSLYERDKYRATLAALSRPHYRCALEIGCSIGVFTERLAPRCEALLAIDASETALASAKARCAAFQTVTFEAGVVPAHFPEGRFDLILLSEVIYYFDEADLKVLAARCGEALAPDGEIVLCHWLGETDYPLTGRQASELFIAALSERLPVHTVLNDDIYRLDRLELSGPPRSTVS